MLKVHEQCCCNLIYLEKNYWVPLYVQAVYTDEIHGAFPWRVSGFVAEALHEAMPDTEALQETQRGSLCAEAAGPFLRAAWAPGTRSHGLPCPGSWDFGLRQWRVLTYRGMYSFWLPFIILGRMSEFKLFSFTERNNFMVNLFSILIITFQYRSLSSRQLSETTLFNSPLSKKWKVSNVLRLGASTLSSPPDPVRPLPSCQMQRHLTVTPPAGGHVVIFLFPGMIAKWEWELEAELTVGKWSLYLPSCYVSRIKHSKAKMGLTHLCFLLQGYIVTQVSNLSSQK